MKKRVLLIALCMAVLFSLTACNRFSISVNTVGKNNTTAKKMAAVIEEDLLGEKGESAYRLYGIEMSMNTEDIGKAKLIYTDKLPQNLQYSDITVVTVDTRTGEIESMQEADFATMGATPYESIVDGAPLEISSWKKDSDEALSIARNNFYAEDDFIYNYVSVSAVIENEIALYRVDFISFVNHLQYSCAVDAMTGTVLTNEITEL